MASAKGELQKYQDALHENLQLLMMDIQPSKDVRTIFKRNMFAKSNKAAFQHIIYYLLTIIYPKTVKQLIPSWPLYEIKMESQFRNEVSKCISQINTDFEDADIPPMMASQFVSPGGRKFIKFMFKLSQLGLRIYIAENSKFLTGMVKKSDLFEHKTEDGTVVKEQCTPRIDKIKILSKDLEHECIKTRDDFNYYLKKYAAEAEDMQAEIKRLKFQIPRLEAQLKELQSSDGGFKVCRDDITELMEKFMEKNNYLREQFDAITNLMEYLLGKDSCFEYQPEHYKIPEGATQVLEPSTKKLDLNKLLEAFKRFIEKKRFDIREVTSRELAGSLEVFSQTSQDLTGLSDDLSDVKKSLNSFFIILSNIKEKVVAEENIMTPEIAVADYDSSLATPLPDNSV